MQQPQLRDYQKKCINDIYSAIKQGRTKIAVSMPTGSGKSHLLSKIASDVASKGKRVLILVHRKPLVQQLAATLEGYNQTPEIIAAGLKGAKKGNIVLAMVQTLDRRPLPEGIDVIILDEAHITTYFDVFKRCLDKYLGSVWALSNKPVIGFSATFWRTNKKEGYCTFFNYKVEGVSPRQLIKKSYLVKPVLYTYQTKMNLQDLVIESSGDFSLSSVRKVCNEEYMDDVVDKWHSGFSDLKTILFTSQVSQAKYYFDLLQSKGINAAIITGTDKLKDRDAIFSGFKSGAIRVIINVSVLTEGYDEPSIECVVLARPTKSIALLIQMIGRGLRLHPGKKSVVIMDVAEGINTLLAKPQLGSDADDEDDIFQYNGFTLCPLLRAKPPEALTKACSNCGTEVSVFLSECPECGTPFSAKDIQEVPDNVVFPDLVEFKTSKESKMFTLLRQKLDKDFKQEIPATVSLSQFKLDNKFTPPDLWAYGAIFKDLYPTFNYQFYSWYLTRLGIPESHIARCLAMEFGSAKYPLEIDFNNWVIPSEPSLGEMTAINYINASRG